VAPTYAGDATPGAGGATTWSTLSRAGAVHPALGGPSIAFLGAGRLVETIIRGALQAGGLRASDIVVTCRRPERAAQLRDLGLTVAQTPSDFAAAELVVLGVRQADLPALLAPVRAVLAGKPVISLVVGVPSERLEAELPGARVVRAITNTPAAIRLAVTAIAGGRTSTPVDLERARAPFSPIGEVVEVPESLLAAVNAISGVGPAYLYALARALVSAGEAVGLPAPLTRRIATQTPHGAAVLLATGTPTAEERTAEVAGPGGSTRAALEVLDGGGFDPLVGSAVQAAVDRAEARDRASSTRLEGASRSLPESLRDVSP